MLSLDRGARPHLLRRLAVLGAALTLGFAPGAGAAGPAPARAPTGLQVKTGGAGVPGYASATLTGTVGARRQATTYFFQYGPTTRYGSQSQPAALPAGAQPVAVASAVAGLNPLTQYHFRLVAIDTTGTAVGGDMSFTTAPGTISITVAATPSPVAFGAPLSISGTVNGPGGGGRTVVLQANPYPFTGGFQTVGNPQVTSPTGAFAFTLLALPVTSQFLVVTLGPGQPASGTLTEYVTLAVTLRVAVRAARGRYPTARFSGVVGPAAVGGRVSLQRLVGGQWRLLLATTGQPTPDGRRSTFAIALRLRHGGYYRAFASAVEDGHAASTSPAVFVPMGGATVTEYG